MIQSLQHANPIDAFRTVKQTGFADFFLTGTSVADAIASRRDIVGLQSPYASHVWVYAIARKIAESIAGVPFQFFTGEDRAKKPLRPTHSLIKLWEMPNPMMSQSQFIEAYFLFLVLRGDVIVTMEFGGNGVLPSELWINDPAKFRAIIDSETKLLRAWMFRENSTSRPEFFDVSEVIYDRIISPDDPVRGLGPLGPARQSVSIDLAAAKTNEAFFVNGAEPGLVLATEQRMSDVERKTFQVAWETRHQGPGKAKRVAVLSGGLKPHAIGLDHQKMQFLEQRQFNQDEILVAFNTPRAVILKTTRTGAIISSDDSKHEEKVWWTTNLVPKMTNFEWAFWAQLFKKFGDDIFGEFDRSAIVALRDDFGAQVEIGSKLFALGYPANIINERLDLGMPIVPWGNTGYLGANLLEVGTAPGIRKQALLQRLPGQRPLSILPTWDHPPIEQIEAPAILQIGDPLSKVGGAYRLRLWQRNIRGVEAIEGKLANALRRFFFDLRRATLRSLNELSVQGMVRQQIGREDIPRILAEIDNAENRILISEIAEPALQSATQRALNRLGDIGIDLTLTDPAIAQFAASRVPEIQNVLATIRDLVRKQITFGIEASETISQISDRVRNAFNTTNSRAFMIARTEVGIASDGAFFEGAISEGVEEHDWLSQGDDHVRTVPFNHKIDGQVVKLGEEFSNGLRFPHDPKGEAGNIINCFPAGAEVQGCFVGGSKSWYSGPIREIHTSGGRRLTTTANHPILTTDGWKFAVELSKGDALIAYCPDVRRQLSGICQEDNQQGPAAIENVFETIRAYGTLVKVQVTALDFHRDAAFIKDDIDIVWADGKLLNDGQSGVSDVPGNIVLVAAPPNEVGYHRLSPQNLGLDRVPASASSFPRGLALKNGSSVDPLDPCPLKVFRFGSASDLDSSINKSSGESASGNAGTYADLLQGCSPAILVDKVVDVVDSSFSGHVYDLQSVNGIIVAEGIVTSNCRCLANLIV